MKPIAYSYKRWSSTSQGKGHTEERQTELAEEYCHRHGQEYSREMVERSIEGEVAKNAQKLSNRVLLDISFQAISISSSRFLAFNRPLAPARIPAVDIFSISTARTGLSP